MDTDVIHPDSISQVYAPGQMPQPRPGLGGPGASAPAGPQEPSAPRFTLPLRDLTANDGDQAVFRVFYQGQHRHRCAMHS